MSYSGNKVLTNLNKMAKFKCIENINFPFLIDNKWGKHGETDWSFTSPVDHLSLNKYYSINVY